MSEEVQIMQPEMVEGLKQLHPDELTEDEHIALDIAEEANRKAAEEAKENSIETLAELIKDMPDAPTIYDLEGWRDSYGVLHMSSVTGDDIYIWRILKRQEYKGLFRTGAMNDRIRSEDAIIRKCLLYPRPNDVFMTSSGAGIITTLKDQIMYQSGFISEQQALSLIKMI